MRKLSQTELAAVTGGAGTSTPSNTCGGKSGPDSFVNEIAGSSEALVFPVRHIIERLPDAS